MEWPLIAIAVLALAACTALACDGDDEGAGIATAGSMTAPSPASGGGATLATTIRVQDDQFSPDNITVAKGTKVTWDWAGSSNPHGIIGTNDNASGLKSETHSGSGTYEATFPDAGEYDYRCVVHGAAMRGKITVR